MSQTALVPDDCGLDASTPSRWWSSVWSLSAGVGVPMTQAVIGLALIGIQHPNTHTFVPWTWAWILIALALVRGLAQVLAGQGWHRYGTSVATSLRHRLLNAALDPRLSGMIDVAQGERDIEHIREGSTLGMRTVVEMIGIGFGVMVVIACWEPWLAVIPSIALVWAIVMAKRQLSDLASSVGALEAAQQGWMRHVHDDCQGMRTIRALGMSRWRSRFHKSLVEAQRLVTTELHGRLARGAWQVQGILAVGQLLMTIQAAWWVAVGHLSVGALVAMLVMTTTMLVRAEQVPMILVSIARARHAQQRFFGSVSDQLAAQPCVGDASFTAIRMVGGIAHPAGCPVLDGIDVEIQRGELVAMVGGTGAGKSAVAAVLAGELPLDGGRIEVRSGASSWTLIAHPEQLAPRLQVLSQEPELLSGTIHEQFAVVCPSADLAVCHDALRAAGADDVLARPDGWQSTIGDRGSSLSGGQRQRLALARALVQQPAIVCLDDNTRELDVETEAVVMAGLRERMRGGLGVLWMTTSARIASVADRVVLVHEGRSIAVGSHQELLATQPRYRELMGVLRNDRRRESVSSAVRR